jgi:hypothetical protein
MPTCKLRKNSLSSKTLNKYKDLAKDYRKNDVSSYKKFNSSVPKIEISYPTINNCNFYQADLKYCNQSYYIDMLSKGGDYINIIISDDEPLNRLATVRTILAVSQKLRLKINIIETEDGIETAYFVYKAATLGVKISMIFSDENMNFFNGTQCSKVVYELNQKSKLNEIPFYLVTSFSENLFNGINMQNITKILNKPLCKNEAYEILNEVFVNKY